MSGNSLIEIDNLSDICNYASDGILTRILGPKEVEHILKLAGAFWMYEGDPCKKKPHAVLTSGKHSNGFVNVGAVIKEHPSICELFAHSLALLTVRSKLLMPHWVVGADTSSTLLAGYVAKFFDAPHIKMIKTETAGEKKQTWDENNISSSCLINFCGLQVEELITTALSAQQVRDGMFKKVDAAFFNFCGILPVIVDRSDPKKPVDSIGNSRIVSLLRLNIKNYEVSECPYCKIGSEALLPKKDDNWQKLTA